MFYHTYPQYQVIITTCFLPEYLLFIQELHKCISVDKLTFSLAIYWAEDWMSKVAPHGSL